MASYSTLSSHAANPVFGAAINLSNDGAKASEPAVESSGSNVAVAWTQGTGGVYVRVSSDGGSTWSPPTTKSALKVSTGKGTSSFPAPYTEYQNTNDFLFAWTEAKQIWAV